jgi:hypothetical protein
MWCRMQDFEPATSAYSKIQPGPTPQEAATHRVFALERLNENIGKSDQEIWDMVMA